MTSPFQTSTDERARRLVHAAFGLPAFLLLVWPSWVVLTVVFVAIVTNVVVLPRLAVSRRWFRSGEGLTGGIVLYPVAVAIVIIVFRHAPLVAMSGWLSLSFGDSAASWIGRRFPLARCPWNRVKSIGGSLAFVIAATLAVFLAARLSGLDTTSAIQHAFVCAAAGAALESLPLRLNDNLVIAIGVALVAWLFQGRP